MLPQLFQKPIPAMKPVYKICLANIFLVLVVTAIASLQSGSGKDFLGVFALFGLAWGVIGLIVGLMLLASHKKQWAQGFLLSSAILFLIGYALCSSQTI